MAAIRRVGYTLDEAKALQQWVEARDAEYGQALRFILTSGARIGDVCVRAEN